MVSSTVGARVIECNDWAEPLYQYPSPYDYRIVDGGRGASKTHEITQAIDILGHQRPLRICVAREHLKSIEESAKPELHARIRELGLERPDCYTVTKTSIDHANGTHIFFLGLSRMSEEDIKGLAQVDLLWIEEGHRMSKSSWELTYPTIRKDDSEIWISFNPQYRYQVAWELAQRKHDPLYWIKHITWRDNMFFTARNNRDRLRDKQENPLRYDHIWEGQPDDVSAARKVLPYALLRKCVEAWDKRPERGAFGTAGFDVADTGAASNTLALRSGPELFHVERWRGSDEYTISRSASHAAEVTVENGITRLDYDAGGVGAGVRGPAREWVKKNKVRLYVNGCTFNGKVQGENVIYILARPRSQTNKQYYRNWGAQAGMAVRMRADMTSRLMSGEDVDPHKCLFINPNIPNLEDMMADMSQAEWDDDTGKLRVVKQPHGPGEALPPSPDVFDSVRLAFSTDAKYGLKATSK